MLITEAWGQLAQEYGILADASGDRAVDLVVRVPGWTPVPFDVQVFTAPLTPTLLGRAANRQRQAGHHARLLVVVPSATENLIAAAATQGVSVLIAPSDVGVPVAGMLVGPEGLVLRLEPPRDAGGAPQRRRPGRTPWGTYAVAFALIADAAGLSSQRDVAHRVGLTQARVSQVLRDLGAIVALSPDGPRFDPKELGTWLVEHYPRGPRVAATWLTLDAPIPSAVAAHELLESLDVEHAVSGEVAADWLAPWARPLQAWMWSRSLADLTEIGATPVGPREANLTLAVAEDPYLLASARRHGDGPPTVAPWRVWVDLVHQGHDESAEALMRALLKGSVR